MEELHPEPTRLLADLYPGSVKPVPAGVPSRGKIRVVVTDVSLTVLWQGATAVERHDTFYDETVVSTTGTSGTTPDGTQWDKGPGCSCGSKTLKTTTVWPSLGR